MHEQNTYDTIRRTGENSVELANYEVLSHRKKITINYWKVIFSAILVCMTCWNFCSTEQLARKNEVKEKSDCEVSSLKDGFVFPESDIQYLTRETCMETINTLEKESGYSRAQLLRFSVNEIYARRGYSFQKQFYQDFYGQYEWYRTKPKTDVTWSNFNEYEKYNLELLLELEKQ